MRRLVQRDPQAKLVAGDIERAHEPIDIGLDEVQRAAHRRFGREDAQIVLAEHTARQVAEHAAELRRHRLTVDLEEQGVQRAAAIGAMERLEAGDDAAEGLQVGVDPARAIDDGDLTTGNFISGTGAVPVFVISRR